MGFFGSIIQAFTDNGAFFMWAILALQIVSIAIIVERVMKLYFKDEIEPLNLIQSLQTDIRAGNLTQAYKKVSTLTEKDATARLAEAALSSSINMGSREEIQARLQETLFDESTKSEKRIGFLSVFANLATLMGLLGTIAGLIEAFLSIGNLSAAEKSIMLSKGIALAMNTTAYGLLVAIPSLLAFAILQNKATQRTDELSKAAMQLLVLLGFQSENSVITLKKINQ